MVHQLDGEMIDEGGESVGPHLVHEMAPAEGLVFADHVHIEGGDDALGGFRLVVGERLKGRELMHQPDTDGAIGSLQLARLDERIDRPDDLQANCDAGSIVIDARLVEMRDDGDFLILAKALDGGADHLMVAIVALSVNQRPHEDRLLLLFLRCDEFAQLLALAWRQDERKQLPLRPHGKPQMRIRQVHRCRPCDRIRGHAVAEEADGPMFGGQFVYRCGGLIRQDDLALDIGALVVGFLRAAVEDDEFHLDALWGCGSATACEHPGVVAV